MNLNNRCHEIMLSKPTRFQRVVLVVSREKDYNASSISNLNISAPNFFVGIVHAKYFNIASKFYKAQLSNYTYT